MILARSHVNAPTAGLHQLSRSLRDPFAMNTLPVKTWCMLCRNSTVHREKATTQAGKWTDGRSVIQSLNFCPRAESRMWGRFIWTLMQVYIYITRTIPQQNDNPVEPYGHIFRTMQYAVMISNLSQSGNFCVVYRQNKFGTGRSLIRPISRGFKKSVVA